MIPVVWSSEAQAGCFLLNGPLLVHAARAKLAHTAYLLQITSQEWTLNTRGSTLWKTVVVGLGQPYLEAKVRLEKKVVTMPHPIDLSMPNPMVSAGPRE